MRARLYFALRQHDEAVETLRDFAGSLRAKLTTDREMANALQIMEKAYGTDTVFYEAQEFWDTVIQRSDEEAVNAMVEILQQMEQLSQAAAQLAQTLIPTTDKDAYYTKRDEILPQLYAAPSPMRWGRASSWSLQMARSKVLAAIR